MYPDMSSRRGNEKWVLTFSFIMVTMLKVYLMVLNDRILGSVLKHALFRTNIGGGGGNQHWKFGSVVCFIWHIL